MNVLLVFLAALVLPAVVARGSDDPLLLRELRRRLRWPSGTEAAGGTDPSQDCAVAELAYEYALKLQPHRAPLREVWDALELSTK